MDTFVRRFIIMSIVYLGISSLVGIAMLGSEKAMALKFVHSHLNMLGWVSMMIYGVGYHILPKFMGRAMHSRALGEIQFWMANIGLVAMLLFYTVNVYSPSGALVMVTVAAGVLETVSIFLFFYNMLMTLMAPVQQPQ
jgi:cytochrome c oxidase cbb3-type subunit 1